MGKFPTRLTFQDEGYFSTYDLGLTEFCFVRQGPDDVVTAGVFTVEKMECLKLAEKMG